MEHQQLYTTQQAAALIGFTDSMLRYLVAHGKANPAQQIGGTWMFTLSEIERLRSRPKRSGRKPK